MDYTALPKQPGIYLITNNISGKIYIGSTSRNLRKRIKEHIRYLERGKHHNKHLQHAYIVYGKEVFSFDVLEECNAADVLHCELFYIEYFRYVGAELYNISVNPLNVWLGYKQETEHTKKILNSRQRYIDEHKKEFSLISPDGIVYSGRNVLDFAKEHKLSRGTLIELVNGNKAYYNGWRALSTNVVESLLPATVTDQNGDNYTVEDIRQFATDHNLDCANFNKLLVGVIRTYKGWTVAGNRPKSPPKFDRGGGKRLVKPINLISPDSILYTITNIRQFCREHNFSVSSISRLGSGKLDQYKGWKLATLD